MRRATSPTEVNVISCAADKDTVHEYLQRLEDQNVALNSRLDTMQGMLQVLLSEHASKKKAEAMMMPHQIRSFPNTPAKSGSRSSATFASDLFVENVELNTGVAELLKSKSQTPAFLASPMPSAHEPIAWQEPAMPEKPKKIPRIVNAKKGLKRPLERLVASKWFEFVWFWVVLINAILLGVQVEMNAQNPSPDVPTVFVVLGAIFAILFVTELVLRFFADGSFKEFFWKSDDYLWNIFDTIVVLLCLFDALVEIVAFGADVASWRQLANTRIVRMVRVLRLVRAVRILKVVRNIAALRTLIRSTVNTLAHVGWAIVLIVLVIYILGLVFTDAVTMWVTDVVTPQGLKVTDIHPNLAWFSDGLHSSCQTLWWSITGGIDYSDALRALILIDGGWVWGWVYNFYVAFMFLGALNVMTGVVCERAMECTEKENEHELALGAINREQAMEAMVRLRRQMGKLEADEPAAFDELMKDEWFNAFLAKIECDQPEVGAGLFNQLFDGDGDGQVDLDEFVEGCLRLKFPAKAFDIASMRIDMMRLQRGLHEITHALRQSPSPKEEAPKVEKA